MSAAAVNTQNCDLSPSVPEAATEPKSSSSPPMNSQQRKCQECLQQAFRYVCPRCSLRTCSLHCCVAHKKRTGCNGQRDRTHFLRVSHMNDATLVSDYHFLEDVLGTIERAKRTVGNTTGTINNNNHNNKRPRHGHQPPNSNNNNGVETMDTTPQNSLLDQIKHIEEILQDEKMVSTEDARAENVAHDDDDDNNNKDAGGSAQIQKSSIHSPPQTMTNNNHHRFASSAQKHQQHFQLGPKWRHFWQQAQIRGIHLLLMPKGMQRRKDNSSYINKKDNVLHWKIDVRMHPSISSLTDTDTDTAATATSYMESTIHSLKLPEHAILWKELQQRRDHFLGVKSPNHDDGNNNNKNSNNQQETIHWLMRKLPSPSNRPCFIEISSPSDNHNGNDAKEDDPQSNTTRNSGATVGSLQSILQGTTIIEYPTIEGVPESRLQEFPRAIQEL